jgi:hypothetical protein
VHRRALSERLATLQARVVEAESTGQAAVIGGSDDLRSRYLELKTQIAGDLQAVRALTSPRSGTAAVVGSLDQRIYRRLAQLDAALHLRTPAAYNLPSDIMAIERAAMARSAEVGLNESRTIRDLLAQLAREQHASLDEARSRRDAEMASRRGLFATCALASAILQAIGASVLLALRRSVPHAPQPLDTARRSPVQQRLGRQPAANRSAWSRPACSADYGKRWPLVT